MAQRSASRLLDLDPVDQPDRHDEEMGKCYEEFLINTSTMSMNELHAYVHDTAAARATMLALLYSVLTDRTKADSDFELLRVSNRDNYATILRELDHLIETPYFPRMKSDVRRQLFWMVDRLTAANVAGVETLHLQLLRQIPGGDTSQSTTTLCKLLLDLCEAHRPWVESRTRVLHTYVYIFLRTIADHKSANLKELQQSEVGLVIKLMRDNWPTCCSMGRDFIRALQDVSKIPEVASLWDDILNRPQSLHKSFNGMLSILQIQTPPELLRFRLTPQMEISLRWIFDKLTASNYQRNLEWFVKRWLSSPSTENFYADVIRYIVAGWYPSNELLQSNKIPRYAVIGSLFTYIKSHVTAANVKLSLFLDWLFFTDDSNIMLIEPAMLLMERSIKYHPYITAMLVEFLRFAIDEYYPPLSGYIIKCVGTGMKELLRKGVIKRLITIYNHPTIDDVTKRQLMDMFASSLDFTASSRQPTPQRGVVALPISNEDNMMNDLVDAQSETKASSRATTPATPAAHEGEDQELDEYLYGTDNTTEENHVVLDTAVEDQIMTEANGMRVSIDSPQIESDRDVMGTPDVHPHGIQTPDPSRKSEEMDTASTHDFSTDKISDSEEEDSDEDAGGNEQHQQSFWMFADLLPRFQDASKTIKTARLNNDIDEIQAHSYICKKNLREILNIYLKMAIPAKNLVPSLAKYIRDSSCSQYANIGSSETNQVILDQEEAIRAETMDTIDLLFVTIWSLRDSESQKKKMVDFISCVMHLSKRGGKHLIGMRWWSFFARVLEAGQLSTAPLFPETCSSVCEIYQSIVIWNPEISSAEASAGISPEIEFKQYLAEDLRSLQDSDLSAVQQVTPILCKFLPDVCVGNIELIRILVSSLLPNKISSLTSQLSCNYLTVFGSDDLGAIIVPFMGDFEQIVLWRLLHAEFGSCADKIDLLMDAIANENVLELPDTPELLIALPTIITSVPPNPSAIRHMMSMLPEVDNISSNVIAAAVELLNRWKGAYPEDLQVGLMDSVKELISAIKSEPNDAVMKVGEHVATIFAYWWKLQKSPDNFWTKSLLSQLVVLGDLVQGEVPSSWRVDTSKKSKKRQSIAVFSDSD